MKKENLEDNLNISLINNKVDLIKEKNYSIENELNIIIKKSKEELSIQNKKLKEEKNEIEKINKKLKVELTKFNKINRHIISVEKELEKIQNKIAKINKKKLYNLSLIIKEKSNLTQSTNINNKYLSLLNIGLNNKTINSDFFDLIINNNPDELFYYLNYIEKHYKNLEKENKEEFEKCKKIIIDYFENENIPYPYDILLLYLNNIFKNTDLSNILNEKTLKLKEIELKKNILDTKIRNLEINKSEKENIIKEINNYIELLMNIIEQYLYYQNQYKNNLISKEVLSKKIKKIKSINLQQWNPERKKNNILKENNSFMTIQNTKYNLSNNINKSSIITINNDNNISKQKFESKSQNNIRNIPGNYIFNLDKPLCKKASNDKLDTSFNDSFNSFLNDESEKENISDNDEKDSPISKINITTRKKNSINIYQKKLSGEIFKKNINSYKNNSIPINNNEITINDYKTMNKDRIYNQSLNIINDNNNLSNSQIRNFKEKRETIKYDTIQLRKKIFNKNDSFFSNKVENNESLNNNKKNKGLFFVKKIQKTKKYIINKDKLFNNVLSNKIKENTIKKKYIFNNLKFFEENKNFEIIQKKEERVPLSDDRSRLLINNRTKDLNKISYLNEKFELKNNLDLKENKNIKNIFYDMNPKTYNDSIQVIKDEIKKRNFISINAGSIIKRNLYKKNELKKDFENDNCCISCT